MDKFDINNLTLEEKLGQMLIFGFDGLEINDHVINIIKKYKGGNILLFSRNINNPAQLYKLNMNLQKLAKETIGLPLFITIDQEGGMVSRIQSGATFFPGAMTIAATNDSNNSYTIGKYTGIELSNLLVNMDFAPCLDVNNNPKNPVIGVRSFSDDPNKVSEFGLAYIKGLQEEGVFATAKHFPGHGDTFVDSHLALPRVEYDRKRIDSVELVPFKNAIKEGVKAIMTTHIVYPELTENDLPATLSKKCLTGLLRNELGFEGLIVTDGMEMKAIKDNYTVNEGVLMAVNAGADLFCICHYEDEQSSAMERLKKAVENNELTIDTINERVSRILKFKKELGFPDFDKEYKDVKNLVENEEHLNKAYDVCEKAATLVKGNKLVLKKDALFIGLLPKATTGADDSDGQYGIIETCKKELPLLKTLLMPIAPNEEDIKRVIEEAKGFQQIIITTYNSNVFKGQLDLLKELVKLNKDLHVISMRNPYDLYDVKEIPNYVCLYEYTPNSIRVLIRYLKGEITLKGKMPISYE
ncbi:beta-N-acetylhexosaminidase [Acholeplasma sp. OttesenSCG-928-E16]|nr:beta-N-acetylhexosaminidase [Acholeplasma sp. OttesenSCG-928-E16]